VPEASKKGGVYVPEWIWKALQGFLAAAVVGGYGMFYTMHSDIAELKIKVTNIESKTAKLETEIDAQDEDREEIREALAPVIKWGLGAVGTIALAALAAGLGL